MKIFGKRLFRPRSIWIRRVVQWFFFLLVALISINHTLVESGAGIPLLSSASLHALCPFGGVVTIYQYATVGTFVQKIHESAFILMIIGFVLAFLFGPVFCGWVCPLGTVQEWVAKLGRYFFKRNFNHFVPVKLDNAMRYLRYLVLAWVIYVTATSGTLMFAEYDPYFALFNFWSTEVSLTALGILGLTLLLSFFVERPWCKYACPYGAVLGITNLFRVFQIRRVESTCKADGACSIMCPMNIPVDAVKTVRDHQCISCLECTSEAICPVAKTVVFNAGGVK
ncbi:MAG: 4Fe-4S binding protein [Anaerolineales bacterium]|nr:4Fe-4S binding protein [Anaerolineales bacterium]MBP6211374.1 4Fe-4S binding protein [Anaerolineales bacterium]MBP8164653.1 4Fe-4S binding protein [Anaerolineales bacterium]